MGPDRRFQCNSDPKYDEGCESDGRQEVPGELVVAGCDAAEVLEAAEGSLDAWMAEYNELRTHQGRWCFGKTPKQTFLDSAHIAREKQGIGQAA
jgi:hypothetical protein